MNDVGGCWLPQPPILQVQHLNGEPANPKTATMSFTIKNFADYRSSFPQTLKLPVQGVRREFREIERRRRYAMLRRRQIKAETEAWEQMVEEYRELEREMCEKKLAPNLPYVKKLLLACYFNGSPFTFQLVMKVLSRLRLRLLNARNSAKPFLFNVRIHNFLEKTKKHQKHMTGAQSQEDVSKETMILRKRVKSLIKRNRIVELGCRLLELLTETAYVQSPVDQAADTPPDIRPAFRHIFRIATRDPGKNIVKKYGVIECDPLVIVGVERTASNFTYCRLKIADDSLCADVGATQKWRGYDKGGYFVLAFIFDAFTHGSRRQQDAVRSVPVKQMQQVYEVKFDSNASFFRMYEASPVVQSNAASCLNP
ncbi:DNA-directed RNA polymerase 3B, chloroplastic [Datura stramonium]|uniref:DNA-directed RNA polymerase 3B, chloroplastic n=1 Tax=Datura stramonium TaxID=4076 RepID=A0ABS8WJX5_DATST|nr:DNA-directed RNA polymerase 3B, chloroplastic [Datura stramonium]